MAPALFIALCLFGAIAFAIAAAASADGDREQLSTVDQGRAATDWLSDTSAEVETEGSEPSYRIGDRFIGASLSDPYADTSLFPDSADSNYFEDSAQQ